MLLQDCFHLLTRQISGPRISHVKMIMNFFIPKFGWTGETRSENEARDDTTQKAQNPAQRQEGY